MGGCSSFLRSTEWVACGSRCACRSISGRRVDAPNMFVWLVGGASCGNAAKCHGQLVDGVKAFKAFDGRRTAETWGSTRKATSGVQYDSGLEVHSRAEGST
jgi:hypothetical protein